MGISLVKLKKILITSSLIPNYDVIIAILMSQQPRKWKGVIASLFLMD